MPSIYILEKNNLNERKYENKIFLWPWLHFGWN